MNEKATIGSVGYIMKKETLASYKPAEDYGILVLEDMAPFPGYYEFFNIPRNKEELFPRSVFLVLKSNTSTKICEDKIIRKTIEIKKTQDIGEFDAAISELELFNEIVTAIRVKLEDISLLEDIVNSYKAVGIKFKTYKTVREFSSLIKVRRWVEMQEKEPGICKDLDQADTYYIDLATGMPWEVFEEITIRIKNNFGSVHFDAALAAIFTKEGVKDLVRVYDRQPTEENLLKLMDMYKAETKRLME
jgi:hypothetical protein